MPQKTQLSVQQQQGKGDTNRASLANAFPN